MRERERQGGEKERGRVERVREGERGEEEEEEEVERGNLIAHSV